MMIKNRITLFACLLFLMLMGCKPSESKKEQLDLLNCNEIVSFPVLFSYSSDILKNDLNLKGRKPLTEKEKAICFKKESVPSVIYDSAFSSFPVNKINFATSQLFIYLVREIQVSSSHSNDYLIMVIYDNEGRPMDFLAENLMDVYSSTQEIKYTSRNTFEVIDTDREYSPDPESEAEDIKNGREVEPSVSTQYYHVDTLKFKFVSDNQQ